MNTKTFIYKGRKIRYVDEGEGEPLFFIHGWGVSPFIYQRTIYELGKKYRVIAPYLRESNTGDAYDEVKSLIDELAFTNFVLVAHSSSGIIAVQLAYRLAKRIRALILVGTMGVRSQQPFAQVMKNWLLHIKNFSFGSQKEEKVFLLKLTFNFIEQIVLFPRSFFRETKYVLTQDVTDLFASLELPILLIWAKDDKLVPLRIGEAMVSVNKHAKLKIVDGGHNWLKLRPQALLQYIEEFTK